jgi:hypothetical protein
MRTDLRPTISNRSLPVVYLHLPEAALPVALRMSSLWGRNFPPETGMERAMRYLHKH